MCTYVVCLLVEGRIHATKVLPLLKYLAEDTKHDTSPCHIILASGQPAVFSRFLTVNPERGSKNYQFLRSTVSPELGKNMGKKKHEPHIMADLLI